MSGDGHRRKDEDIQQIGEQKTPLKDSHRPHSNKGIVNVEEMIGHLKPERPRSNRMRLVICREKIQRNQDSRQCYCVCELRNAGWYLFSERFIVDKPIQQMPRESLKDSCLPTYR